MRVALFAATMFLSAALSFLVQPMIGKQLLPLVGGTPGVWNACLVFFQAMLLLGYLYAHRLSRIASVRTQRRIHYVTLILGAVWFLAFGMLRPDANRLPSDAESPVLSILLVLFLSVGGPFFVLATTAPLLQTWYATTGTRNPYALYAASNAGSFLGLLGYPFAVEPWLALGEQRTVWCAAFVGCIALIAVCGALAKTTTNAVIEVANEPPPNRARRLRWVGLAALTSSFLMSVTAHLTTDIAPVPLLWVVPLGLYLLSFVIVFARWPASARRITGRLTPMLLCFLVVSLLTRATEPMVMVAGIHLLAFFAVALLCHGELAADRPTPKYLTAFYLWISVGGVLGGLVNTFLAPLLFAKSGYLEYPIAVVLVALIRPAVDAVPVKWKLTDLLWVIALTAFTALIVLGLPEWIGKPVEEELLDMRLIRGGLSFGIPAAFAFALVWQPLRFAICLAAVLIVGSFAPGPYGEILETSRNFFGTLRVTRSADKQYVMIVHGTTQHGQQRIGEQGMPEPLMYYHRKGPLGRLFGTLPEPHRVGVVGLGCGAMAAYAKAGQDWTFYEIDPAVVAIAKDARYFTFLANCPTQCEIVLGDARRQLMNAPDGAYDLFALDAFSSDAVPVHLLTREAFALYIKKLSTNGTLAFHVSNRYLDLPPLVGRLLKDADPDFQILYEDERFISKEEMDTGKQKSIWVFATRNPNGFGKPPRQWYRLQPSEGPIWTDDFSNLLGVWRREE